MKMIGVGGVVIWRQRDAKNIASGRARVSQKFSFLSRAVPIFHHTDKASVAKLKGGHIPGICESMFRPFSRAISALAAAGIGAVMMNFRKGLIKVFLREIIHFALPEVDPNGERALHMTFARGKVDVFCAVDNLGDIPTAYPFPRARGRPFWIRNNGRKACAISNEIHASL